MRKCDNFERSIIYLVLIICNYTEISHNSITILRKLTYYICEYIVNYNSKYKNKKNLLNEKDLYNCIYKLFTPSSSMKIISHLKNNKKYIKQNLILSETYINNIIKNITKRPFKYDYIIQLIYIIEFIIHEILEQAVFLVRNTDNFITKNIIINCIKTDIDIKNILNVINIKIIHEHRIFNVFTDAQYEKMINNVTNNKKVTLSIDASIFIKNYIASKLDDVLLNVKNTNELYQNNLRYLM